MFRRVLTLCCLIALISSFLLPVTTMAQAQSGKTVRPGSALADFPTVDPNYIYDQLFYMATHYQRREAGYDNNLPVNVNGHDEFAQYWTQEITKDLQGFGPQTTIDKFPVQGWIGRPATVPAFNVEVTVPGFLHPEQVVVIGCHYDGEAISTQSANDDASGCAIELGVAKALGEYWHSHNLYPARTLRFVIFDAEEQGLFGSYHYLNQTINGDINNIVAMFNEEQNGIAYPLRFLGQMSNPLLPFYILTSPLKNNFFYPNQDRLTAQQRQNILHFDSLLQQAVTPVFQQFQALGYTSLPYYNSNNQSTSQPVFTADQQSNIQQMEDNIGGSDENPFIQAGLPSATFVGNSTYYDQNPPPPKWSYPFDQPQDTIQLMNTFASGSAQKSEALTLALAIPGMFTTWMLNQPDVLGSITPPVKMKDVPVVAISDIGQTVVNKNLSLSAQPLPSSNTSNPWAYSWNFGDGGTAKGLSVNHIYTKTGTYTLSLTASAATGSRTVFKTINVVSKSTPFNNLFAQYPSNGVPPVNHAITLPVPDTNPGVQAPSTTPTTKSQPDSSPGTSNTFRDLIIGLLVVALLAVITIIGFSRRTRHV
ncbi:MAG TPA: M28 family peptidase [Ktedonobacteraceae bacterium]|nr:M28 family peptidase [Ktedonobacteraceae bacterium]